MAYQIKSTPFFRRIVSTSKKNGDLQRLKEEYERSREFGERTIDVKIRQVRLHRLYREIADIKDSSLPLSPTRNRCAVKKLRPTPSPQLNSRLMNLIKAKELGKEYSRLNAIMMDRSPVKLGEMAPFISATYRARKAEKARRELAVKRLTYGNEMSRTNLLNFSLTHRRPRRVKTEPHIVDMLRKRACLQERLRYGNSRSTINMMSHPSKHVLRHKKAASKSKLGLKIKSPISELQAALLKSHVLFTGSESMYKTLEKLQRKLLGVRNEQTAQHAKQKWRYLTDLIRNKKFTAVLAMQRKQNCRSECREVVAEADPNTKQPLSVEKNSSEQSFLSDCNPELSPNEETLKLENEYEDLHSPRANNETFSVEIVAKTTEIATCTAAKAQQSELEDLDVTESVHSQNMQVDMQQYKFMFEPIVRNAAQQQVLDYGFQKLREMFEPSEKRSSQTK